MASVNFPLVMSTLINEKINIKSVSFPLCACRRWSRRKRLGHDRTYARAGVPTTAAAVNIVLRYASDFFFSIITIETFDVSNHGRHSIVSDEIQRLAVEELVCSIGYYAFFERIFFFWIDTILSMNNTEPIISAVVLFLFYLCCNFFFFLITFSKFLFFNDIINKIKNEFNFAKRL